MTNAGTSMATPLVVSIHIRFVICEIGSYVLLITIQNVSNNGNIMVTI